MVRSVLGSAFLIFFLASCGDSPTGPSRVAWIEGHVVWAEDGSPVEGVVVSAYGRSYGCSTDWVFGGESCAWSSNLEARDTTDSGGYYRLSYGGGCVNVSLSSVPGYEYQSDLLVGVEHYQVCGGQLDVQLRVRDPRLIISGTVTSSIDGAAIGGVTVEVYGGNASEQPIGTAITTNAPTAPYAVTVTCEEVAFVRARCLPTGNPYLTCAGWEDSERIRITSDCPAPGEDLLHDHVDFELAPTAQ